MKCKVNQLLIGLAWKLVLHRKPNSDDRIKLKTNIAVGSKCFSDLNEKNSKRNWPGGDCVADNQPKWENSTTLIKNGTPVMRGRWLTSSWRFQEEEKASLYFFVNIQSMRMSTYTMSPKTKLGKTISHNQFLGNYNQLHSIPNHSTPIIMLSVSINTLCWTFV